MDEQQTTTTSTPEHKSGMNMVLVAIVVILAVAGVGFMIVQNQQKAVPTVTTEVTPSAAVTEAMILEGETATDTPSTTTVEEETDGEVKVIKIEAGSFYYKPNTITVKKGDTVRIEMEAVDMMHNFIIDELNVEMPIVKSGSTGSVEFTADTAGEFEYYCGVGSHRKMGQVGTLIVEE